MKKLLVLLVAVVMVGACYKPDYLPKNVSFALPSVSDGKTWDSKDHKGKPVFIAVMATYCGYCKMSVPMVNELYKKYEGKIEVVGMFSDTTTEGVKEYIKEQGVKYPVLYNAGPLFDDMGVDGVPHFALLDKNHLPIQAWSGYSQTHNFDAEIEKVLK